MATTASAAPTTAVTPTRASIVLAFAAVYLVWGSTYLAIRWVLESLPPLFTAGLRFLLAGAVLLAWAWWSERGRPEGRERVGFAQWKWSVVVGGLLFLGGNGAVMWAEQRVPSGVAALMVAFMPCWLVLLEWLGPTRKVPAALTVAGLVTGTAGLVLLVGLPVTGASSGGSVDLAGAIVLLLGSFAWAAGSLVARSAPLARSHVRNSGMQMVGGGVLLTLAGLAMGELGRLQSAHVTQASLLAWLYLVIFGSLIGFTAFAFLMRTVSPAKVATYAYVNPVVAVLLGWALASEPVTARILVASAVIVGAVVMITRGRG
jgi:drug/metabolite transporter (DMT)-like permease